MNNKLLTKFLRYVDWVFYNKNANEIFEAVYGTEEKDGHYRAEKIRKILRNGLGWFTGELDGEHQQRFVEYVLDTYDKDGEFND